MEAKDRSDPAQWHQPKLMILSWVLHIGNLHSLGRRRGQIIILYSSYAKIKLDLYNIIKNILNLNI